MVSISSPLPRKIADRIDMNELLRLERENATTSNNLSEKQNTKRRTSRIDSQRLKRLRRAVVRHSKNMLTKKISPAEARSKSEKRARREAQHRIKIFEKRSPAIKRRNGDDLMWYNQVPSFYRGSPSEIRRRRSLRKRSPSRRKNRQTSRRKNRQISRRKNRQTSR